MNDDRRDPAGRAAGRSVCRGKTLDNGLLCNAGRPSIPDSCLAIASATTGKPLDVTYFAETIDGNLDRTKD